MRIIFSFILIVLLNSCSSENELFEIKLDDINEKNHLLSNVENNLLTVFYFLAPECPLSQNYTKEINEVSKTFSPQNVMFYGVFCGEIYSDEEIRSFVSDYKIELICLKDEKYELSSNLNATITPEVFVLDNKGRVVYSGKIDNWIESLGVKRQVVTSFFLKDALNQYLDGEPVLVSKTEAVGCIIE